MTGKKRRLTPKKAAASDPLTLEAELLDVGAPPPKPGTLYVVPIMRYKVLRVVKGNYPHPVVLVGHHLPNLNSPQFRAGARHRLELIQQFPKQASLLNPFESEAAQVGVFFCSAFELIDARSP